MLPLSGSQPALMPENIKYLLGFRDGAKKSSSLNGRGRAIEDDHSYWAPPYWNITFSMGRTEL